MRAASGLAVIAALSLPASPMAWCAAEGIGTPTPAFHDARVVADGSPTRLRLADMGMGALGPRLGGSGDDMVVDDPGHSEGNANDMVVDQPGRDIGDSPGDTSSPGRNLPQASDMTVTNPGFVPQQPAMDIAPQQDLDQDDDTD